MEVQEFGAWRAARELAAEVYRVTRNGPFTADATLRLETRDRAVAIMTCLAGGYGCGEFRQHLVDAAGSARELNSLLYLALDAGFIEADSVDRLRRLIAAVTRHIDQARRALDHFDRLPTPHHAARPTR
jgi:four helix bundle protein